MPTASMPATAICSKWSATSAVKLQAVFGTTDRAPHTLTLDDALLALSRITYLHYDVNGRALIRLPHLDNLQSAIFETLGVRFPANTARCRQQRSRPHLRDSFFRLTAYR
jgi:hypothetical protein